MAKNGVKGKVGSSIEENTGDVACKWKWGQYMYAMLYLIVSIGFLNQPIVARKASLILFPDVYILGN